jgi:hypothetical protein
MGVFPGGKSPNQEFLAIIPGELRVDLARFDYNR